MARKPLFLAFPLLAAAAFFLLNAHAAGPVSYTWFDGQVQRTAFIDDTIVAEFPAVHEDSKPSQLQRLHRDATPLRTDQGHVRLWRVSSDSRGLSRSASKENSNNGFSPVMRDGEGKRARMRALPGNIIVTFKPSWTEAAVKAWAAERKLELLSKLELGANIYVIKTAPGLESLEIANKIHLSGEVVSAQPDWWLEHAKR